MPHYSGGEGGLGSYYNNLTLRTRLVVEVYMSSGWFDAPEPFPTTV